MSFDACGEAVTRLLGGLLGNYKASHCMAISNRRLLLLLLLVGVAQTARGDEPSHKATAADLNQAADPFTPATVERLKKLIHENISIGIVKDKPKTPAAELSWSQPSGGLVARIDYLSPAGYGGFAILLRLKNQSKGRIKILTGTPGDPKRKWPFEVQARQSDGVWRKIDSLAAGFASPTGDETLLGRMSGNRAAIRGGNDANPPPAKAHEIALQPGESCVLYLDGSRGVDGDARRVMEHADKVKVTVGQPKNNGADAWTGALETPPFDGPDFKNEAAAPPTGALPFPDSFPALNPRGFMGGNMSGEESRVACLTISNAVLLRAAKLYEPAGVRREFERRMAVEKDSAMRLLMAAIAATVGSERGAAVLLEAMKATDYETVGNVNDALALALDESPGDPPDWIIELIKMRLLDDRYATELEKAHWSRDTVLKISYIADEYNHLALRLGQTKSPKVVPFLIDLVKRTNGSRMPVMALGDCGDPRAIPVLLECMQRAGKTVKYEKGIPLPDEFSRPVWALSALKAKEAVPALLQYIQFPDVIEALQQIGDKRALPDLQSLVASKGKLVRNGVAVEPALEQKRYFEARLAVATLDGADAMPRLVELLDDKSLGEFERRDVAWRMGELHDPRAAPALVHAVKTDPSGAVVNQAIEVLSVMKAKAAVEGLIECFDANFDGKSDWKRAYTPEMYRAHIADSLRAITGVSFGTDKQRWLKWWNETGKKSPQLK